MQFPESWLREFCNPPLTTEQLAELLTMSGMEVEDLRPAAPPFSRVVVGEVDRARFVPDAAGDVRGHAAEAAERAGRVVHRARRERPDPLAHRREHEAEREEGRQ